MCGPVTIGFGFTSDWLREWHELFQPIRKRNKTKPKLAQHHFSSIKQAHAGSVVRKDQILVHFNSHRYNGEIVQLQFTHVPPFEATDWKINLEQFQWFAQLCKETRQNVGFFCPVVCSDFSSLLFLFSFCLSFLILQQLVVEF